MENIKQNLYAILSTCLCLSIFIIGCTSKESFIAPDDLVEIEVNLNSNETYKYDLGNIAIEGGYSIRTQARHFYESEIQVNNSDGFGLQYIYTPSKNFKGNDNVVLLNCISAGSADCNQTEYIKFNFVIKN